MIEYFAIFGAGIFCGAIAVLFLTWKTVRMYKLLWQNEKNGNFLITKKMIALEEKRLDDED